MNDLTPGNIIKISYYTKKEVELSDKQKQKNRTLGIGTQIEAVLNQMIWDQANKNDLVSSVSKGYNLAKNLDKQEFFDIREVWVQISHKETNLIISEVEKDPLFHGWVDPMLIHDIKTI